MRPKTYNDKQLHIIKKYYPDGKWDMILPHFPNKTKADIRAIARKNNIKRVKSEIINEDISGQHFYKLTAISRLENAGKNGEWKCLCDCGNETIVSIYNLKSGKIKSCGCLKHAPAYNAKDFTGRKFGMLTAVERLPQYNGRGTFYRCLCECGREKIVCSGNLISGHTRSCGVINHQKIDFDAISESHDDIVRKYSIYRHISPAGKSYIGITMQNPERRFQNGYGYKTQIAFYRAIQKYGWENFRHEILEENLTEKEACEKEAYYISKVYKSFAPNGYNTREGGTAGRNHVTPVIQYFNGLPVNFFESISIASKEMEVAQKTIKIHCGADNSIEGYHFVQMERIAPYNIPDYYWELNDEAHKKAMKSIIAKDLHDRTVARNKNTAKVINKYDLDGHYICTFSSLAEARNSIEGCDGGAIDAAVNPKRQGDTAYGYMWKYDTGDHSDIEPVKYKAQKSVLQIDSDDDTVINVYKSMSIAAKSLGVSMRKIRKACAGDGTVFQGFYLRYRE